MDQKRVVAWLAAALIGALVWTINKVVDDVYERVNFIREAHLRHIEWHQERSREQPSVWRSR